MAETVFSLEGIRRDIIGDVYITDTTWRVYKVDIQISDEAIVVERERDDRFWMFVEIEDERIGTLFLPVWGDEEGYISGEYELARELLASQVSRCKKWAKSARCQEWDNISDKSEKAIASGSAEACYMLLPDAFIGSEELLYHIALQKNPDRKIKPVISFSLFGERVGAEDSIGIGPDWPVDKRPKFVHDDDIIDLALDVIGGTTLPNFWRWIEYERGNFDWQDLDKIVDIAKENNIVIKSFSLYWGGMGGTPPWFRKLDYPEQLKAIEEWVTAIVGRYKGAVDCWETVNEMHNWRGGNPFCWSHEQILEVTRLVNELVGTIDPGTTRLINHCCITGDYVQSGRKSFQWADVPWKPTWSPLDYLDAVCKEGIEFEAIGIQFYNPARDIATCYQLAEEYAKFGKQLQITEMGTPSTSGGAGWAETGQVKYGGGWRGDWAEQSQALWVDRFFTIFGLVESMAVMNYWDLYDARAFILGAGLIGKDGNPKPSYNALKKIADDWK